MTCSHGRVTPSTITKLRLFADSGGYCANPDCLTEIFRELESDVIHIGEIAHIISAGDDGPRANLRLSDEERSTYENLILLCPTCHTIIDKAEEKYSEVLILSWKRNHKEKVAAQFGIRRFNSRDEARASLLILLRENRTIFDQYGPDCDERFNPESSLPGQWRRKIRAKIIPNNRKILNIIDANGQFLSTQEQPIVEYFRQHVEDFEAKHLENSPYNGEQFPQQLEHIFGP